ncbi:MAG: hypothetical protein EBR82_76615 [Caulobacteraceae bacterium]|nr:hypothetical protein [Caulobacteraceae bacterium]
MSLLRTHGTLTVTTTSSTETMLVRVTAPSNHKIQVRVRIHNQSSTPAVAVRLLRAATGGTLSSELLAKIDTGDAENVQSSCKGFTVNAAPTGGVVVDDGWVTGNGAREFRVVLLNGGETLTVAALSTGATASVQTVVDVDE